ncbi:MAG TPA: cytochrome C oxidase Cbb3 [Chryseosolibacter sp.]
MDKNVLQNIDNIAIWPVISFIIFFLFFLCLIWYVLTADRKFIEKMKSMPLENNSGEEETELQKSKSKKVC